MTAITEDSSAQDNPCSMILELNIDKCKFYPLKPLAVLAGNTVSAPTFVNDDCSNIQINIRIGDRSIQPVQVGRDQPSIQKGNNIDPVDAEYILNKLPIGSRCLVYVQPSSGQVPFLMKKWSSECRETKKCTNWTAIAEHRVSFSIDVDPNEAAKSLEPCRKIPGAWMLRSSRGITEICDPPTIRVTMLMDQSKFYPTKLAILDGVILNVDGDLSSTKTPKVLERLRETLENGERCWLHVRSNVLSLLRDLHGVEITGDQLGDTSGEGSTRDKSSTGWVQLTRAIPVVCEIIVNQDILKRKTNMKGAVLLECHKVIHVEKDSSFNGIQQATDAQSDPILHPMRANRKERHRIFAEWLVKTYGADILSTGSGVLDVAGGNGALGMELWKFGIPSVLLDPDPRCDNEAVPFQVISKPLMGDGSDLTTIVTDHDAQTIEKQRRIRDLIQNCSIIAGMHPDEATEAVIDTSLRLAKPFAILPCCVFRNLNAERKALRRKKKEIQGGTDPFRSYNTFCHYLLNNKAPAGIRFQTENLPFEGRNKVVFLSNNAFYCQEIITIKD